MDRRLLLLLFALGCADKSRGLSADSAAPRSASASTPSASPSTSTAAPSQSSSTAVPSSLRLSDEPTIDLLGNRYRFHTGAPGSLFVPIAAEGLRKYSQDYSQPWAATIELEGRRGRVLSRRSTVLRIPWQGPAPASIQLHIHGLSAGQKVTLRVNGKSAGTRSVDRAWTTVSFPGDAIQNGENELEWIVGKRGSAAGHSSWALWNSLRIGGGELTGSEPLEPVRELDAGGAKKAALTGHRRFSLYIEIPPTAHLVVDSGTSADAELAVRATPVGGSTVTLWTGKQTSGWKQHRISLPSLANQLVVLELESSVPLASGWANARIALEEAAIAARPKPMDNAVLVVVDALRADRLSAYGPTRVKTPRISAEIAARGAVFLHNQAASPSSPPSHGSIQTGMIPRVHGVVGDKAQLHAKTPMLSTQARAAKLAAGYYGNNTFGMARLEKPGNWTEFHQPAREGRGIDCTALIEDMLGFAKRQKEQGARFVVSSLPFEPHTPYRFHEGISDSYHPGPWGPPVGKNVDGSLLSAISGGRTKLNEAQWAQLRALYDGEVTYFDQCFGTLLDGIRDLGLSESTAVILTSDHGEGMFEHGRMGHAFGHYAELGNIPLVLFVPGLTEGGIRVEVPSSHIDIVPTILDLLGVDIDARVQGRSLLPLLLRKGPWTPRVVSLEYGRSYSLRSRQWRLIVDYSGDESLFDLASDPSEQKNIAAESPVALRYLRDLSGFFLAHRSQWTARQWGDLANHRPAFAEAMAP